MQTPSPPSRPPQTRHSRAPAPPWDPCSARTRSLPGRGAARRRLRGQPRGGPGGGRPPLSVAQGTRRPRSGLVRGDCDPQGCGLRTPRSSRARPTTAPAAEPARCADRKPIWSSVLAVRFRAGRAAPGPARWAGWVPGGYGSPRGQGAACGATFGPRRSRRTEGRSDCHQGGGALTLVRKEGRDVSS